MEAFCIKERRGCASVSNMCCWEGRCNVNKTGILHDSEFIPHRRLGHGILQDSSHRETVRIRGLVRGNIMTEMQVSSFKTSHLGQHGQREEASWIG